MSNIFSNTFNEGILDKVLESDLQFGTILNTLPSSGNLVYEYNPFRNYRLQQNMYRYKNHLYTIEQLEEQFGITIIDNKEWKGVPSTETDPVLLEAGTLVDFETDELSFDLQHPVNILPQYSYDGSVNLIINDGKNQPRLINSRFTATGKNTYKIIDRQGNNDTNIYDQGDQFNIDTSLYKLVIEIPKLQFMGLGYGGIMPIGQYHFYFKFADADGNETDFVAESGLVSVFIGSSPGGIRNGFRDENSHKTIQFYLSNIDSAYQYVHIYYTRSTSDYRENSVTQAYKINKEFIVNNALTCNVVITGYEDITEISVDEINTQYNIASAVDAQTSCQNMLFLGNIHRPSINYKELQDLSLRFLPNVLEKVYDLEITQNYEITSNTLGYYDPQYIYDYVGYWNEEIYRLGIVYILPDNSLSPVFNIRGRANISNNTEYTQYDLYDDSRERMYISINEETNLLTGSEVANYENAKGVIQLSQNSSNPAETIYGLRISTSLDVISELKKYVKGFFFVRQKRIPTILCQAATIAVDNNANIPVIPSAGGVVMKAGLSTDENEVKYLAERFLTNDKIITNDFMGRLTSTSQVRFEAAIAPEYDINPEYFNSLFTGDNFSVTFDESQPQNNYFTSDDYRGNFRHFYFTGYRKSIQDTKTPYGVQILGVEDNTALVSISDNLYRARAGEAEEAYKFEYLEKDNEIDNATNLIRGSFGPYLALTGFPYTGAIINIRIPNYSQASMQNYFKIRYDDKSPFYAISDRISINEVYNLAQLQNQESVDFSVFRGDCYICQFTHRLNRNFQDPEAPTNDKIVDENTWKNNYDGDNKEKLADINRGDINAVQLGMWITFKFRSTFNLNIRNIDESNIDETALTGHPRGFYPYFAFNVQGEYKTPEALCVNKAFQNSLSERYNFELPQVPYIKNEFNTRIMYSDISVNDAFKNGFRVFQMTHYRDYPKTYGSIIKLVDIAGSILCVFEHGIATIPVNERTVAGSSTGGNVYINTSNVLPENPRMVSDMYGSQWPDSVIKTPNFVYGVDTIGRKIWRTNGIDFEIISDFKIQEFLNNNISLSERELTPIIGIRNVKTHYNAYKKDIMFTFYDNLYGFEEKVWNVCFNELLNKWITFYSWVPSYSENINNSYFSFDRNTSKYISKLGVSRANNDFSDGITLDTNIIANDAKAGDLVGHLSLSNRSLPSGDGITSTVTYTLQRDNFKNYEKFEIPEGTNELRLKVDASELLSELYVRDDGSGNKVYPTDDNYSLDLDIYKADNGRREYLTQNLQKNSTNIVSLLNIQAKIDIQTDSYDDLNIKQYIQGWSNNTTVNQGYYESVVAVMPQYNMQFLTTDFWRHGQAGIIDISDKIYPTYWYGKQHPFEFEFVVADNPDKHKIFDNLEIISNNAEPDSFHYEIVGDCYDFAKDKKNMYIRQEATKELYQYNGSDITYDHDYINLQSIHRPLKDSEGNEIPGYYDRSTLLPLYYSRQDTINDIEDYYHLKDGLNTKDFSALAGGEIVHYNTLNEYRLWNHAKAVDMQSKGRLRGNMQYNEDKWLVQINPINVVYKNETQWTDLDGNPTSKIPVELGQSPIPSDILTDNIDIPEDFETTSTEQGRGYVTWGWKESQIREVKPKDKWIKIRIRYTGSDLAIITAIKTIYSISYS